MDSAYINKAASYSYTWSATGAEDGNAVDDIGNGGKGERRRALYSFANWVEVSGNRSAEFAPVELFMVRGLSLGSSACVQWFRRLNAATREMFAGSECGVHIDNARPPFTAPTLHRPMSPQKGHPTGEGSIDLSRRG